MLAVEAPVVLADEPTASLDPRHQIDVMKSLRAAADHGVLVMVVTHDLGLAARFADTVLVLSEGRLASQGAPADGAVGPGDGGSVPDQRLSRRISARGRDRALGGNLMRKRFATFAASVAVAVLATSGAGSTTARAAGLPRIVSMNVCADQALLTLADPEQILGLSRFSRDAWVAGDVRRHPALSGGAEDVLVLKPDIVVASLFDKRATRELSEGERAASRRIRGAAQPRRGEGPDPRTRRHRRSSGSRGAANRPARRGMARARRAVADKHYRVLPLSRRGWVAGSDSLVSSLLVRPGCSTAPAISVLRSAASLRSKQIVSLKPDLLLVSQAGDFAGDDGQAFLLHPALEHFYPLEKRIVIPERLTECGGVRLAEALDVLVKELKRVGK